MSPAIEEQYKSLTRDYDNAQNVYRDLLTKKSSSELATNMENQQQGEQMSVLNPASLPSDPSFPNRLFFAGGGLGAGLALGIGIAHLARDSRQLDPHRKEMRRRPWTCRCWFPCRGCPRKKRNRPSTATVDGHSGGVATDTEPRSREDRGLRQTYV